MRKSKYIKDSIDIMKMTNAELKQYIRAASKSFSKRIKEIEKLPYAGASETIQYIRSSGTTFTAGGSRFGTKGLNREQLLAKAHGVNEIARLGETAAKFRRAVEEEIKTLVNTGFNDDMTPDDFKEIFENRDNFEAMREYVDTHIDSIYSLISSDRVSDLADEYEEDAGGFYTQILKEAIDEYQKTEIPARERFFKEKRKKTL